MEREKYSRSTTPKDKSSQKRKPSTQFFGDVDSKSPGNVGVENEQFSPVSAPVGVSTMDSPIVDDSPTLKPLEPRVGGVSAEESATIRSLDARLKQLQAE